MKPSATLVVLLPGNPGDPAFYRDFVAQLRARGHEVLLEGHEVPGAQPAALLSYAEHHAEAVRRHLAARGQRPEDANLVLVGQDEPDGPILGFIYGGPVLAHNITREIEGRPRLADFDCEINIVHCRHAVQGKGLGRALIAEIAHHWQVGGKQALMLWAFRDNDYKRLYEKLGGEVFAEGIDEGAPDVAYGWQDIESLIAACVRDVGGLR